VMKAKHNDKQSWLEALSNLKTEGLVDSVADHQVDRIRVLWGEFYEVIISNKRSTE
jgi:hypothetical protein